MNGNLIANRSDWLKSKSFVNEEKKEQVDAGWMNERIEWIYLDKDPLSSGFLSS